MIFSGPTTSCPLVSNARSILSGMFRQRGQCGPQPFSNEAYFKVVAAHLFLKIEERTAISSF